MLDTETKRRIDTARDILVGKVPDPKSQVEQITIALIYKFMDDMDAEAEELGGERRFFSGEYEPYGWKKLIASGLGGFEVLTLYAEAIQKLNINPNIPQLFRDIFKNAYLPYRDPQTLKSFLKTIDEFNYDHSERLGDAFEYLLSVLGSQGDAGQFRTPRHIIDFMVYLVDPKKNETILDPACGTAGFLISSYKHIVKSNSSNFNSEAQNDFSFGEINSERYSGDKLTPDERTRLALNVKGYDISPDMVRLSLVNLYLHGFADPRISEYDTLTSEDNWNEHSDIILANPPFMSPKGGIKPHKRFSVESNRSEVLFVDYIAEHLSPNGRAAVIVPEGIIFQSGTAYKALRKMLVENYLYAVVSLPSGVFNPYSGVKTSILLMDKTLAKKTDKIVFAKVENEGFDLGAQRRANDKSELPTVANAIKDFAQSIRNGTEFDADYYNNLVVATKEKISKNSDWGLSGERYNTTNKRESSDYSLITIGEICQFEYGKPLKKEDRVFGDYPVFGSNGIVGYHNEYLVEEPFIIIGRKGSAGEVHYSNTKGFPIDTTFFVKLESENIVLLKYLYHILKSLDLKSVNAQAGVPGLNRNDAYKLQIPLPPLDLQKEIVSEIEGWQKIIDGARQVVENYKPKIEIDPSWEMVEMGEAELEIIDGDRGKNYPSKEEFLEEGFCVFLNTKNVLKDGFNFDSINFISEKKDNSLRSGKLKRKDIVLTTRGTIGNVAIYDNNVSYENIRVNSGMLIFRPNNSVFNSHFIFWLFQTEAIQQQLKRISSGCAQPQLPIRDIKFLPIPMPRIEIQNKISEQMLNEKKLINSNKQLIKIFEAKIKAKIAKLWGE